MSVQLVHTSALLDGNARTYLELTDAYENLFREAAEEATSLRMEFAEVNALNS